MRKRFPSAAALVAMLFAVPVSAIAGMSAADVALYAPTACGSGTVFPGDGQFTCASDGVGSVDVSVSYTALKTRAVIDPAADAGASLTGGGFFIDAITLMPEDPGLLGENAIFAVTLQVDGTLQPGGRIFMGGDVYIDRDDYVEVSPVSSIRTGFSTGLESVGVTWVAAVDTPITDSGAVTFLFPTVFGEQIYYRIGLTSQASGPGAVSDFFNTALVTGITAYTNDNPIDSSVMTTLFYDGAGWVEKVMGTSVAFSVATLSGTDLVAEAARNFALVNAPIPEPETWALMLGGLCMVTTFARVRRVPGH